MVTDKNDARTEPEFRDHYYTLGIDIDATGEAVEQTYWQRIRASRLGDSGGPARPQNIIDLNEAYRVLMTPELRSSYDVERAEMLGASAAPRAPQPERSELPLRVMETQLPALQKRSQVEGDIVSEGWSLPVPPRLLAGSFAALVTATLLAVRWLLF